MASFGRPFCIEALPAECEAFPAKCEALPAKSEALPAECEAIPAKSEAIPAKSEAIPAKCKALSVQAQSTGMKPKSYPFAGEATKEWPGKLPAASAENANLAERIKPKNMELTEKGLTLYYADTITTAETDMRSRLRVGGLVNLLIQAAICSADSLGFGFANLRERQLYWVLRSLTLEVERPLMWREAVQVETWPKDVDGIQYLRDFVVRDASGAVVARATSSWLAIDIASKRPKRVTGREAEYFIFLKDKHAIAQHPEKLEFAVAGEPTAVQPTFFDIDLNGHVTTTRYIDWMMDTFAPAELLEAYPSKVSVTFLRETLPTDRVELRRMASGNGSVLFEGTNTVQGVIGFRGEVRF